MSSASASNGVLDFSTQVYHGSEKHPNLWAVEILPPAGHHFNLGAPRAARADKLAFDTGQESSQKIIFQKDDRALKAGATVEVSAFICDEKKTYCLKKKMSVALNPAAARPLERAFVPLPKKSSALSVIAPKVEEYDLFIDNDPARAITEAAQTKKPLFIDFYGIWCPPCNLYEETVFNSKEFESRAKKYVLLKMDVDQEKSWELKSKFKVAGYPTLVMATVGASGAVADLKEVGRIVGYYAPKEFLSRLDTAYAHRNESDAVRWKGKLEEQLGHKYEQKDFDGIIQLTEKAAAEKKSEKAAASAKILIYRWLAQAKKNADFLKDEKNLAQFRKTVADMKSASGATVMRVIEFLTDESWLKQDEWLKTVHGLIASLEKRVDPKTLFVKGTEITAADLDTTKMDVAEELKNDSLLSEARKSAIRHYEKLMALYEKKVGMGDFRSLNLEYAYLLWKDGRVDEAKAIYNRFIRKYPLEFTFYFAASKMYFSLKDYGKARELGEKAVQYSYGDNRIRVIDHLVRVMAEQGQKKDAIKRANEFLKSVKVPEGFDVRTTRYLDALTKTVATLKGDHR